MSEAREARAVLLYTFVSLAVFIPLCLERARLFATMRPELQKGRTTARLTLETARSILTPEQWAKVPERIRTTGGGRRGPGSGGP